MSFRDITRGWYKVCDLAHTFQKVERAQHRHNYFVFFLKLSCWLTGVKQIVVGQSWQSDFKLFQYSLLPLLSYFPRSDTLTPALNIWEHLMLQYLCCRLSDGVVSHLELKKLKKETCIFKLVFSIHCLQIFWDIFKHYYCPKKHV